MGLSGSGISIGFPSQGLVVSLAFPSASHQTMNPLPHTTRSHFTAAVVGADVAGPVVVARDGRAPCERAAADAGGAPAGAEAEETCGTWGETPAGAAASCVTV